MTDQLFPGPGWALPALDARVVPIICDACGAGSMTATTEWLAEDRRVQRLVCHASGCGAVASEEVQVLRMSVAYLCGRGAPGRVEVPTWGPE